MSNAEGWSQIPLELRQRPQWCFTYPQDVESRRRKAPRTKGNHLADVTDPSTWLSFEDACFLARQYNGQVGYVLSSEDPFTCIDLDVKDVTNEPDVTKRTTQAQFDRYWTICQTFDSFTEYSQSGKGLHIWLHGKVGRGGRRDGVEVYSQERFIICTGRVLLNRPVREHQELIEALMYEIRRLQRGNEKIGLEELEEEIDDLDLIERAMSAGNADKFNLLCTLTPCIGEGEDKIHGNYRDHGYETQSQADLALMSIFTFYSRSNEQCRRLFRMATLGKRPKANRDDRYLNETLKTIRSRQANEEAVEMGAILKTAELQAQLRQRNQMHVPGAEPSVPPVPTNVAVATMAPTPESPQGGVQWPPGLAGEMAKYIFSSAPRPVKEVAIVAAIGLLAGICGKAFAIPQSGLNLYIILLARSAIGKEAMHSGVASLIQAAARRQPPALRFVDFSDFASGPALSKVVAHNQSFVNVAGEWGHKLARLAAEDGRDSPMQQLRTVMTNLYQKSGPQSIVGGISYSNKDSNVSSVAGVAYSMIGESTPGKFYRSLTEGMMEDGFLSRFTIMEYPGDRPPLNENPVMEPSKALGDALAELCTHAMQMIDRGETVYVDRTNEASQMLRDFEHECDNEINSTHDEMWRQMWNRASLKVMRISALLAAADNYVTPIVQPQHVTWALDVIRRDIELMSRKIKTGEIGNSDDSRERKLAAMMTEYLQSPPGTSYGITEQMWKSGIAPRKYFQMRVSRVSTYMSHRGGATQALEQVIRSFCDSGYMMEVDRAKLATNFNFHGKAYRILTVPDYNPIKKS